MKGGVDKANVSGVVTGGTLASAEAAQAERKLRNPMAVFNKFSTSGDESIPAAVPVGSISSITVSRKTGETMLLMNPSGVIIVADHFNAAVRVWKKFVHVVVFHQESTSDGSLKIPIAIDASRILRIEPSRTANDGSAVIFTNTGNIKVTETFEQAVEIAQN